MKTGLSSRRPASERVQRLPDRAAEILSRTTGQKARCAGEIVARNGASVCLPACSVAKLEGVPRVFVESFGCRASQADGAGIEASLVERGWAVADCAGAADLVVINTCTVTP